METFQSIYNLFIMVYFSPLPSSDAGAGRELNIRLCLAPAVFSGTASSNKVTSGRLSRRQRGAFGKPAMRDVSPVDSHILGGWVGVLVVYLASFWAKPRSERHVFFCLELKSLCWTVSSQTGRDDPPAALGSNTDDWADVSLLTFQVCFFFSFDKKIDIFKSLILQLNLVWCKRFSKTKYPRKHDIYRKIIHIHLAVDYDIILFKVLCFNCILGLYADKNLGIWYVPIKYIAIYIAIL